MNVNLMGVEMTPDVRAWDKDQRRIGSLVVLAVAGTLLLAGVIAYLLMGADGSWLYWTLVVLLVLLLVAQAAVFALGGLATSASATPAPHHEGEPQPHLGPAGPAAAPAAQRPQARALTLRCGDCGTEFEITDVGERPLHHVCPGCGLEGVLRDDSAPAPAAAEAAAAPAPAPAWAAPPPTTSSEPAEAPAAAAAPAAPALKKLKLRCGGCREVFSIEDNGERPLRRPCPHCGRVGEVR